MEYSATVSTARDYYNSNNADRFYAKVWGGEDIHIGIYESEEDSIREASNRSVKKMASLLELPKSSLVLDIGSGYGGTARYLAKTVGCKVDCLNLSEVQNQRNRELNKSQGLDQLIQVIDGDFENIPVGDNIYDVVLSQDAMLHSGNRSKVLAEVDRVLKKGGQFIFTDIMQKDDCPAEVLQPILDRIKLDSIGSMEFYKKTAASLGFTEIQTLELSEQLVNHYSHVLQQVEANAEELVPICGEDYLEQQKVGLKHWIEAGKKGYIQWGILHFKK